MGSSSFHKTKQSLSNCAGKVIIWEVMAIEIGRKIAIIKREGVIRKTKISWVSGRIKKIGLMLIYSTNIVFANKISFIHWLFIFNRRWEKINIKIVVFLYLFIVLRICFDLVYYFSLSKNRIFFFVCSVYTPSLETFHLSS
jgi:hypothetical protein